MQVEEIRTEAFSLANKIIGITGPRLAGTKQSLEAATLLEAEMKGYADHVDTEDFIVHKGAFLGWIRILVVNYLLAVVFLWLEMPIVSALLALLSIFILVFQFFFYLPVIDRCYPKKQGMNVIGTIEPKGEVRRQVIISGHHDSARVFNFLVHHTVPSSTTVGYYVISLQPMTSVTYKISQIIKMSKKLVFFSGFW